MTHPPSTSPALPIATVVLDPEALREVLIAALSDPAVVEHLAAALRGAPGQPVSPPTFMNVEEYAKHTVMSRRSLDYARQGMTEGVHYSRNGRRIRYHVVAADEFLSNKHGAQLTGVSVETDLKELARQEAARRRPKPLTGAP
jgi:hypothetical protein